MEYFLVVNIFFCKLRPDCKNNVIMGKKLSFMVMPLLLSLLIALVFVVEWLFGFSFVESGIYPRTFSGIKGILFAPFVHSGPAHLLSNLSALPVLLCMLAMMYRRNYMTILCCLWIITGVLVWLMARGSYHVGVSGVIYALASFLFFGGILSSRKSNAAISLVVIILYGNMVWGLLPNQPHVSWESHLMGGVAGFACAFVFVRDQRKAARDSDYDYVMPGFSAPVDTLGCGRVVYSSGLDGNITNK